MNSPSPAFAAPDEVVLRESLHDRSLVEALKHKWIESEKRGCDLGEEAIRHWIQKHWNGYLRERWIEHLEGKHFWIELSSDDFGLLKRCSINSCYLDPILTLLKARGENLSVINCAIDNRWPMDEVHQILEYLDVNSARIECQLLVQPMG